MADINEVLSGFKWSREVPDDVLVSDVTVLLRCVDVEGGQETLVMVHNQGAGGVMQLGMIQAALMVIQQEGYPEID